MSNLAVLKVEYGAYVEALTEALAREDEEAFFTALDHIVHLREPQMFDEIRKLTGDLQTALERFSIESRLVDFAENEIPDARARLAYVIKMTDEAAHRTMDLVEASGPLAEKTAREAAALQETWKFMRLRLPAAPDFEELGRTMDTFLSDTQSNCEQVRRNLAEVVLAQGYQDLTGQIIRSVMKLVDELQKALSELRELSGGVVEHAQLGERPPEGGPVIPGVTKGEVATAQTDVDALLSGLGV